MATFFDALFGDEIDGLKYWAENGDAKAQFNLGLKYFDGNGVEKNYKQALYWYQMSAMCSEPAALNSLGVMYLNGYGVEKDTKKAFEYFKQSSVVGNPVADSNLGLCYENGLGVMPDQDEAVYYYRKSIDGGHFGAELSLSQIFYRKKDFKNYFIWLEKAAAQKNANAMPFYHRAIQMDILFLYSFDSVSIKDGLRKDGRNMSGEDKAKLEKYIIYLKYVAGNSDKANSDQAKEFLADLIGNKEGQTSLSTE